MGGAGADIVGKRMFRDQALSLHVRMISMFVWMGKYCGVLMLGTAWDLMQGTTIAASTALMLG